jgi:hypothetical protein
MVLLLALVAAAVCAVPLGAVAALWDRNSASFLANWELFPKIQIWFPGYWLTHLTGA